MKGLKHLFLIDPLEVLKPKFANDSSTALMREGLVRGQKIFVATLQDLKVEVGSSKFGKEAKLQVRCKEVQGIDANYIFDLGLDHEMVVEEFQVVWLRKNPPFDETYLLHLDLFDSVDRRKVFFVNDPALVRGLNEKLTILNFPEFVTDSVVTMDEQVLKSFWKKHGVIVVKAMLGFGGDSVIKIENWERDLGKLRGLTKAGSRFVMAQKFLKNVHAGDKRVTVIDGKSVAVLKRVPPSGSFIAYTGGGATVETTTLTLREKAIVKKVGSYLKRAGVFWAGLDLIDGHLSEINLTSPSFLALADRKFGLKTQQKIWEILMKRFN